MEGTAIISYTITNICGTATATFNVSVASSKPAVSRATAGDNIIAVYPNPTAGILNIETGVNGMTILCTIEGRTLQTTEITKGVAKLALPENLAAGIYMLRFRGNDGSSKVVRLVYER